MWLLSTDRAELHFFSAAETIAGGYAILSHTWGRTEEEQSFQETRALEERSKVTDENPRDLSSDKVRECCLLAERQGYDYVWIDTCCIDKTSSTELSEAINSMFRWYQCAEICYAYLEDVSSDCVLDAKDSPFRTARYHTRGWTLQELIASAHVVFLSNDWKPLGSKTKLAKLLNEITGIWSSVLTHETHFSNLSIAYRMSWASKRSTTRIEDEAYCLMGLFNVNMPSLYGEGRQAFQRLQQEIMKQTFDSSIFCWGRRLTNPKLIPMTLKRMYELFNSHSRNHFYLLAHSPMDFASTSVVRYTPNATYCVQPYLPWQWKPEHNEPVDGWRRRLGPYGSLELPRFTFTSYGIQCRFPVFEVNGITVAMLFCESDNNHFGLILHPSNENLQDPTRRRYHVGYGFQNADGAAIGSSRIALLGKDWYNLHFQGQSVRPEWRELFIVDNFPMFRRGPRPTTCYPLHRILPAPPFRIPSWLINRLAALGVEATTPSMRSLPKDGKPLLFFVSFTDVIAREAFRLSLGTCDALGPTPADLCAPEMVHWARAEPHTTKTWYDVARPEHDCARDHVKAWPGWTRDFATDETGDRVVRLSFSRDRAAPQTTIVAHVELLGSAYEAYKATKGVVLPPRPQRLTEEVLANPEVPLPVPTPSVGDTATEKEDETKVATPLPVVTVAEAASTPPLVKEPTSGRVLDSAAPSPSRSPTPVDVLVQPLQNLALPELAQPSGDVIRPSSTPPKQDTASRTPTPEVDGPKPYIID